MSKYGFQNIPLKALEDRDCIWPVNSPPAGGTYEFCADVCEEGSRYCAAHTRLAYQRKSAEAA